LSAKLNELKLAANKEDEDDDFDFSNDDFSDDCDSQDEEAD
jgi:hypothetical protein